MTDHRDVLDRIDAVIRDAELDELADWHLARARETGPRTSLGAWLIDQVREADQLVQRLRKRGRL